MPARPHLAAIAACLLATPTAALEITHEYRIPGDALRSVELVPHANEDPGLLRLMLRADGVDRLLEIESDGPLAECLTILQNIQGQPDRVAVLSVNMTALTLNGVLLERCGTR
ncbi:hypothetical protein [Pseudoponticoccus marisrubri]|uniref:Uncharacterized protein n=1 Tax=Pseudoponticoccus marisrubri TaxID=1685382 RepID=A0A0W7WFW5_9RHOB|nr:hypothetical protein [Pseudoponticoccus marisrubri]KUF09462.1 hypothetical protein AVJ23_17630 [Pseudoponticoccus marisrubri]